MKNQKGKSRKEKKEGKPPFFVCSLSGVKVAGSHGHALRVNGLVEYPISHASYKKMIKEIGLVNRCLWEKEGRSRVEVRRIIDDGQEDENFLDFDVNLDFLGTIHGWRRRVKAIIHDSKVRSRQLGGKKIVTSSCVERHVEFRGELAFD